MTTWSWAAFYQTKQRRVKGRYGDIEVRFIGKAELVKNKLATKRLQDKVDAERLSQTGG